MLTDLTNIRSTMVLWYVEDEFSVEDDLQWKTTSKQGRRMRFFYVDFSQEYKINQGVLVDGRRPLVKDDLWWKTTFGERRPSVEDNLLWKMTFGRRCPSVKNVLWWKTTFSGR